MKKIIVIISLLFQTSLVFGFELQDFDGSTINLDDKIGQNKWTLVMFWAHDCHICKTEAPLYSAFNEKREDVDVIGISIDGYANKKRAQTFMNKNQVTFPSYITDLTLVSSNYGILTEEAFRGTPTFLLFSPQGKLVGNNPGKLPVATLEEFIESDPK